VAISGSSTPDRAKNQTLDALPNSLCQTLLTLLGIIKLLHFGLETALQNKRNYWADYLHGRDETQFFKVNL
jgi:hypothetical protein